MCPPRPEDRGRLGGGVHGKAREAARHGAFRRVLVRHLHPGLTSLSYRCIYTYIYTYMHLCIYVYICIYFYIYICIYIYTYVYSNIYIYIYTSTYICICICMYKYILYVCIYLHVHSAGYMERPEGPPDMVLPSAVFRVATCISVMIKDKLGAMFNRGVRHIE